MGHAFRRSAFVAAPAILSALLTIAATSPAAPTAKAPVPSSVLVTKKVALRFVTPTRIVALLGATTTPPAGVSLSEPSLPKSAPVALPSGVLALIVGGKNASLTLKGNAGAVASAEKLIALLDKPSRQVQIRLRLLRRSASDLTGDAMLTPSVSDSVVQASQRTITNNEPAGLITSSDYDQWNVEATPRVNGGDSVSVDMKITRRVTATLPPVGKRAPVLSPPAPKNKLRYMETSHRAPSGVPFRVTTFLDDAPREPGDEFTRALYIVEVTATIKPSAKTP